MPEALPLMHEPLSKYSRPNGIFLIREIRWVDRPYISQQEYRLRLALPRDDSSVKHTRRHAIHACIRVCYTLSVSTRSICAIAIERPDWSVQHTKSVMPYTPVRESMSVRTRSVLEAFTHFCSRNTTTRVSSIRGVLQYQSI